MSVSLSSDGKPGFAKMKVVETVDSGSVKGFSENSVINGSEIRTDGLNIYAPLAQDGYIIKQKKYDPKKQPKHLHWTHIIISNAISREPARHELRESLRFFIKAFIEGTFHGLDAIHLQRYLDEFCYRFNRRWFSSGIFSRIVNACLCAGKITAHELIG